MAGADGQRLWDLSRRAASFLRMARLALTGAAASAQLIAKEQDGPICNPYYKSISMEDDDDLDSDELWAAEDESELLVDGKDGSTAGVLPEISIRADGSLNKKLSPFIRLRPATTTAGSALRSSEDVAAAEESSEPLVERRTAKRVNDAEMVHHQFGCDRRGTESSSLLLVSS